MPPAIVVENLGKSYRVSHEQVRGGYKTLRESLTAAAAKPINRLRSFASPNHQPRTSSETFWALNDVNFEVQPGEVVGIIGRNGAGKSTLLKVLSRITKPTTGRVTINGRVGSLLEVGTGFHPELTGCENIFLNGAILGMSRSEIKRKFDEIVDFSGVERFLDMPVKRYSSGMQVRLAFAVAAHLEPEIVVVDEVLAVGDMEFQKKCLGKMEDVARSGRTVLFVSHNMAAVESLCTRGVLLDVGSVVEDGPVNRVIDQFRTLILDRAVEQSTPLPMSANGVTLEALTISSADGQKAHHLSFLEPFTVRMQVTVPSRIRNLHVTLSLIRRSDGCRIASISTQGMSCKAIDAGTTILEFDIDPNPLLPGEYSWSVTLKNPSTLLHAPDLCYMEVLERILPGASHPYTRSHGVVCLSTTVGQKYLPMDA
jgi:lipopolysaccharide transport system ATP-binding protein